MFNYHLKKSLLVALALSSGLLTAKADYPAEVLGDGPITYYRLGDGVTTATFDTATNAGSLGAAGNGIYASVSHLAAGAIVSQPGDSAVNFPLAGAMRTPFQSVLNGGGPFSVEMWVKPADTGTTRCVASSILLGNSGWLFYNSLTAGQWTFRTLSSASGNQNCTGGTVTPGAWHHLVGVWDGTTIRLYVNGVQVQSLAADTYLPVTDITVPLSIGVRSDNSFQFSGGVDEAAYYGSALSPAKVLAHYQAGTNVSPGTPYQLVVQADAPVGYWRLNEPNPTYVAAGNAGSLGASANALYQGGVTNDAAGPHSPAFPGFGANNSCGNFDGNSGFVGSPLGLLNNKARFTVMGWVKRGAVHSVRGGYFGQNDLLEFGDAGSGATIEAWINAPGHNIVQPYPWADDEWGFIALTADGTTENLYFNGALAGSANSSVASYGTNEFKFNIGGGGIFNAGGDYFLGSIDEVAVFDKALTAGKVLSLYMTATGSVDAPFMVSDPPVLTPAGTIYATTPFSLTADVAGALPITYQWRTNGIPIPGATSVTFTRSSSVTSDSGSYELVAANAYGAVTSMAVVVTIDSAVPPTIDTQPTSRSVYVGGSATFSVAASGTMPFTYQWKKGGVNLTGQTNQTLALTNCGGGDVATYTVGVSNVAGGVVSSGALLSLFTPTAGTYEALVAGMGPIAYWRLGETSGTTAFDYAGGHDGNYNNVTLSQPGYSGADPNTAVSFGPGTDSYVGNIQNISFAGPGTNASFTLAFWAKGLPTDLIGDGAFICKGTGGGGEQFCIDGYQGRYRFYGGGVSAHGPVAPDGTWQFVVGVCDGHNNRWLLYVNGKLAASAGVPANLVSTAHEVTIGARQAGSTVYDFNWNGLMDEVTILNRALNSQEICALYFKGTAHVGAFEPSLSVITGTGEQSLTNVNFASGDGGFTSDTPSGSVEAPWIYDGSTWYSAGESTGFGGDNVSYLTSPTNTVTKAGVLKLTFTHRYSFEIGFDGGVVEVSVNGGPWTYIPAVQFDQNGYNGTITEAALGGKRGFVDNSAGHPTYITSSCLLAGANPGDQVNVRFTAAYDNNTTGNLTPPGWQISNVQITQGASGAVSVACPCGNLETKSGDITAGTWQDLGTGSAVISTTKTNQQYFRIQR